MPDPKSFAGYFAARFFPELSTAPERTLRTRMVRAPGQPRPKTFKVQNPCETCPCGPKPKVKPTVVASPKLVAIGLGPGEDEERTLEPFTGPSGQMLRDGLRAIGLDPQTEVSYYNLSRCRPDHGNYESKDAELALKKCNYFFQQDVAAIPTSVPVLLLGTQPLERFLQDKNATVAAWRGLWLQAKSGHRLFVARHPAGILREREPSRRAQLEAEFRDDFVRLQVGLAGPMPRPAIDVQIYPSLDAAQPLLRRLAKHRYPWAFDIESFDGKEFPSRQGVSTDPCHEDFRLRGIAFAWGPKAGAWVECADWQDRREDARALLDPVFGSETEKWAFMGSFDEEGLVYPGWVSRVHNRRGDGMLGLVALSDGRHASLRLERAVVDVLKWPQYWGGIDKARIRDLSLDAVAWGAVPDACATWALCSVLHKRMAAKQYYMGGIL